MMHPAWAAMFQKGLTAGETCSDMLLIADFGVNNNYGACYVHVIIRFFSRAEVTARGNRCACSCDTCNHWLKRLKTWFQLPAILKLYLLPYTLQIE